MIKQVFDIEDYWRIVVFYDLDYDNISPVIKELKEAGASESAIDECYDMLESSCAKAATFSNINEHLSVVLFNPHRSKKDYMNSIAHEAEHVKQAMLKAYNVEDNGELPAYTLGHIIYMMYPVFKNFICEKCSNK